MKRMCQVRGLKRFAIDFQILKWKCNRDLIRLFSAGDLHEDDMARFENDPDLDNQQQRVFHKLDDVLRSRDALGDGEMRGHGLATGPPGTGKSFVAAKLADTCSVKGRSVAIMAPTGALAEVYRRRNLEQFEIMLGTFGGVFRFWQVGDPISFLEFNCDLAVVDEVQYLNSARLTHLWDIWEITDKQALLLAVGDFQQLEPPGGSHILTKDDRLLKVLSCIRCRRPKEEHVTELCFNPPLFTGCCEQDWDNVEQPVAVLAQHVLDHPETFILAVRKSVVQKLHELITQHIFTEPLGSVYFDEHNTLTLHRGMKILITANQDISVGAVSGASGHVIAVTYA